MRRFILLLAVAILLIFSSCGDDNDSPTVIVITPNLSKLDCNESVNRAAADVARRGLGTSGAGRQVIEKVKADCAAENKRRGY